MCFSRDRPLATDQWWEPWFWAFVVWFGDMKMSKKKKNITILYTPQNGVGYRPKKHIPTTYPPTRER